LPIAKYVSAPSLFSPLHGATACSGELLDATDLVILDLKIDENITHLISYKSHILSNKYRNNA
jgi:hypothetical protein